MEVAADGYSSSSSVVEEEEEEDGACFVYTYSQGSNYVFGSPLGRICRSIGRTAALSIVVPTQFAEENDVSTQFKRKRLARILPLLLRKKFLSLFFFNRFSYLF